MSFDINDPSTWPTDTEGLLALGNDPDVLGGEPGKASFHNSSLDEDEDETEPKDTATPAAAADKADKQTTEPAKVEPKAEAKPEADKPEADKPEADKPEADKPEAEATVLAADGKNTLPFSVVQNLRKQVSALQAQLDERAAAPATPAQPAPAPSPVPDELPPEHKARVEDLREKWGDEIAQMYEDKWKLEQKLSAQEASLQRLQTAHERDAQAREQDINTQVQNAIDSTPLLAAWQADTDNPEWYQRAVAMNKLLLDSDPGYAGKTWAERMQTLPGKVQAVYGDSPHAKTTKPPAASPMPPPVSDAEVQAKANARVEQAATRAPTTLSDVAGSKPVESADDEVTQVEKMSYSQLYQHIEKMDSARQAAFLAKFT